MGNIQQYGSSRQMGAYVTGGQVPSRRSAAGKAITAAGERGLVEAVQIEIDSQLDELRLSAAARLVSSAQQQVAMVTAMEGELTRAVPLAGPRLEMMGNLATLGMTEIVTDGITRSRRR